MIIALAEGVKETYHNLKQLMKLVNVSYLELGNSIDTNDLSLTPKYLGIGTSTSTYPCHLCDMPRKDFGNPYIMLSGGNLRKIGDIIRCASEYQEACRKHKGKTKLSSANYYSCENIPLYDFQEVNWATFVLQLMPPLIYISC